MEFTTLGGTGLKVSVAGLGAGGPSRLGHTTGASEAEVIALIHRAIGLGINFIDTAHNYGTEGVVGAAMKGVARDKVVLSTKFAAHGVSAERIVQALDDALRALGTDYLDIFHLHGVLPDDYVHAANTLLPALLRQRERGKVRFIGITEATSYDLDHVMLGRALEDDCWDVMMISLNMMHQSALAQVFPEARRRRVGTLVMAPARCLANRPAMLAQAIRALAKEGKLAAELGGREDPLAFLTGGGADSLMEAAYRFARHQSGGDVVLFGTGNAAHLEANVASLLKPPLPAAAVQRLMAQFGGLKGVGLDQARRDRAGSA